MEIEHINSHITSGRIQVTLLLWTGNCQESCCIYLATRQNVTSCSGSRPSSGKLKNVDDISIDHFVPFSYVSSDEFWNLNPTTKSINLLSWERYFNPLAYIEFQSYTLILRYPQVRKLFEKTAKDHFSSPELTEEKSFPIFWNLSTGQHLTQASDYGIKRFFPPVVAFSLFPGVIKS